jgi:pSer/pThr/pTyr-binding forkhead associated (FHA) protein
MLIPVGGGDPIPLLKPELVVGRRPGCDVRLEFENVSGKHAYLTLINGIWHVRDGGSTNGTSVNGARLNSPHAILPEDEVGFADHLYTIDYVPSGPEALIERHKVMDDDLVDDRKRHSLMELAGLDTDGDKIARVSRPKSAPTTIERISAEEGEFDDEVPEHFKVKTPPKPKKKDDDDDFLKFIEDEVAKPS